MWPQWGTIFGYIRLIGLQGNRSKASWWNFWYRLTTVLGSRLLTLVQISPKSTSGVRSAVPSTTWLMCTGQTKLIKQHSSSLLFTRRAYKLRTMLHMHKWAYAVVQCLSAAFVYCVKMNKCIFKLFSQLGSHTILVFSY